MRPTTEATFNVRLERLWKGGASTIEIQVRAMSKAQAQRRAVDYLPGWHVKWLGQAA